MANLKENYMNLLKETFTLNNGIGIHKIGLGTWQSAPEDAYNATRYALKNGYLHIDTAYVYGNQREIGQAIKDSGIDRAKLFITSKIPAEWKTYEESIKAIDESLEQLGVDYIDLMLIHAPRPWSEMFEYPIVNRYYEENSEMWRALEDAYKIGKLKSIGVSNFDVDDLEHLLEKATVTPAVNQIIYHIGNTNPEVLEFCQKNGILVESYSPIATGRLLGNEKLKLLLKNIINQFLRFVSVICLKKISCHYLNLFMKIISFRMQMYTFRLTRMIWTI